MLDWQIAGRAAATWHSSRYYPSETGCYFAVPYAVSSVRQQEDSSVRCEC